MTVKSAKAMLSKYESSEKKSNIQNMASGVILRNS